MKVVPDCWIFCQQIWIATAYLSQWIASLLVFWGRRKLRRFIRRSNELNDFSKTKFSFYFSMIACPVCCTSFEDASDIWKRLDEVVDQTELQESYQNIKLKVFVPFGVQFNQLDFKNYFSHFIITLFILCLLYASLHFPLVLTFRCLSRFSVFHICAIRIQTIIVVLDPLQRLPQG